MATLLDLQAHLKETKKAVKKLTSEQELATQQLAALNFVHAQLNESVTALAAGKPDPHAAIRAAADAVIMPTPPVAPVATA